MISPRAICEVISTSIGRDGPGMRHGPRERLLRACFDLRSDLRRDLIRQDMKELDAGIGREWQHERAIERRDAPLGEVDRDEHDAERFESSTGHR
jgi:hypothetical protein